MRMRVGHSIAGGKEVDVLRLTLSLVCASADDLLNAAVQPLHTSIHRFGLRTKAHGLIFR
jgi:hypothetical protein